MSESVGSVGNSDTSDLDELLGAYALDAVDADERRQVDDYIGVNPRAAAEVREHREVATMLAFTGMDAPAGVWERIEALIEPPAPALGPELAKVLSIDTPVATRNASTRPRTPWMLAAAAAAALLVAGAGFIVGQARSDGDPLTDAYAVAVAADGATTTELVADGSSASATGVIDADGHGYLDAVNLPALDDSMTYQLWGVLDANGDVVSLGILGADPGLETFTASEDVAALAITIEDAPGVISDGNPDGAYVGTFE